MCESEGAGNLLGRERVRGNKECESCRKKVRGRKSTEGRGVGERFGKCNAHMREE